MDGQVLQKSVLVDEYRMFGGPLSLTTLSDTWLLRSYFSGFRVRVRGFTGRGRGRTKGTVLQNMILVKVGLIISSRNFKSFYDK